jgi:rRNA-processing protein FCF1
MKVLLDTNFLIIPYRFKVDIFSEINRLVPGAEVATIKQVVDELQKIDDKRAAKMAMEVLEKFEVKVEDAQGETDSALLNKAVAEHAVLCTNDIELKKRCLDSGVAVIFMRKKKYLEITGGTGGI